MFGMEEIERPAPVLVAAFHHDCDVVTDAAVGFDSCFPQIIESPQHVVAPERRKREAEPLLIDHLAASKRAEHAAFEQMAFAALAPLGDGRRFVPSPFVCEQSFEHADGRMVKRRSM